MTNEPDKPVPDESKVREAYYQALGNKRSYAHQWRWFELGYLAGWHDRTESEAERVLREWGEAIRKYDSTVDRSGEVQIGCPDAWMNERQAGDKAYLLARKLAGETTRGGGR